MRVTTLIVRYFKWEISYDLKFFPEKYPTMKSTQPNCYQIWLNPFKHISYKPKSKDESSRIR